MATSIEERIAEAMKTALLATPTMPEIGDRVFRAREDAFNREEEAAINITTDGFSVKSLSAMVDDKELTLNVQIYVRGDVWETLADAIAIQAHQRVMHRDYLGIDGIGIAQVRLVDADWISEEGDQTPGKRTMKYSYRYLSLAGDITIQP